MISIILPVYNSEGFIKETINGILEQTEKKFELIIVNDGSIDGSEEIILSFNDKRINYIKQENKGKSVAKNIGLNYAKGEFISFHDSDDLSLPNRFEKLLKAFNSDKVGLVHSDMLLINEVNQPIGYWQACNITEDRLLSFFVNVGTPYNNPTILYRKDAIAKNRFDPSLSIGEDTDFILNCSNHWDSVHISEPLYLYRRHNNNSTNDYDYHTHAIHIRKHLTETNLKEIVTELDWVNQDITGCLFKSKLIVGLALSRRWMIEDAIRMFEEAIPLIKSNEDLIFFEGMKALFEGDFSRAVSMLKSVENHDHIVDNYLGEALLFLKRYDEAYSYFMNALRQRPAYHSPMQNLQSLGILRGHNIIDKHWEKFNI